MSGVSEVKIESKDLKLSVKTTGKPPTIVQSDPQVVYSAPVHNEPVVELQNEENNEAISSKEDEGLITIKSPIIGTFYRKPSPDKPNFVEVGDSISEGSVLCVVEAMKLFNEIESECSGKIVKILVDDASPVEFDQPLFLVDPS